MIMATLGTLEWILISVSCVLILAGISIIVYFVVSSLLRKRRKRLRGTRSSPAEEARQVDQKITPKAEQLYRTHQDEYEKVAETKEVVSTLVEAKKVSEDAEETWPPRYRQDDISQTLYVNYDTGKRSDDGAHRAAPCPLRRVDKRSPSRTAVQRERIMIFSLSDFSLAAPPVVEQVVGDSSADRQERKSAVVPPIGGAANGYSFSRSTTTPSVR